MLMGNRESKEEDISCGGLEKEMKLVAWEIWRRSCV